MSSHILVTVAGFNAEARQFSYEVPVKVSIVIAAANLTTEATGKKLKVRDARGERYITLEEDLTMDSFILITKEVKGAKLSRRKRSRHMIPLTWMPK